MTSIRLVIFSNVLVGRGDNNVTTTTQQQIVDKLQILLSTKALIFWNEFSGGFVGILFRPSFLETKGFNILGSHLQMVKRDERNSGNMDPNFEEIILQVVDAANGTLMFDRANI